MARPGQNQLSGHKCHATGGIQVEGEEGGKIRINLSTVYGLVLGQCTKYLQSRLEGQEKWETMPNKRDLIEVLKSVKSLSHKYDTDTEYHHVAYHTLLYRFMLFCQGDSSKSEY